MGAMLWNSLWPGPLGLAPAGSQSGLRGIGDSASCQLPGVIFREPGCDSVAVGGLGHAS